MEELLSGMRPLQIIKENQPKRNCRKHNQGGEDMIIECSWCKKILGEKAPYEDKSVTNTICNDCFEKVCPSELKEINTNVEVH